LAIAQRTTVKSAAPKKADPSIGLDQFKSEIEKRAKKIFLKRQDSKVPGDALSDWLQAGKEIKAKHHIA
jgi:hypothetical protein